MTNPSPAPASYVFLHGGGQGGWVWDRTIEALHSQADGVVRTLALDIPGCGGKRKRSTSTLTPRDVATELLDDVTNAGLTEAVLVGHSLAGNVLPLLAELRPNLFRRLIYVACSVPLPGQTVVEMMGAGLQGRSEYEVGWPAAPGANVRDKYLAMYCNDMTEEQAAYLLDGLVGDEWPVSYYTNTAFRFANPGAMPASYVLCLKDSSLPVEWQETFARRYDAGRVIRIDAGHQAMITRPHALAEILRQEAAACA